MTWVMGETEVEPEPAKLAGPTEVEAAISAAEAQAAAVRAELAEAEALLQEAEEEERREAAMEQDSAVRLEES